MRSLGTSCYYRGLNNTGIYPVSTEKAARAIFAVPTVQALRLRSASSGAALNSQRGAIKLIELYSWYTSNGRKVSIALEELGLPYEIHPIDITRGEQTTIDFMRVSPNGKIPAIVDQDAGGRTLMESGAILLYLADKIGRLISKDEDQRWRTIEWLMWQMGGIGPFLGQHLHFTHYKPDVSDYGKERYANEARRLYGVLDQRLVDHEYLADDYSIADIATWPWIARHNWQRIDLNEYPHVRRWYVAIAERPAVQRGWRVPENDQEIPMPVMGDEL